MSWELIERAQAGDRQAMEQFCACYYDSVLAFLVTRTWDRPLAQDLTQDTFVRSIVSLNSMRDMGKDPMTWLTVVAGRLFLDHVRSARHRYEMGWPVTSLDGDAIGVDVIVEQDVARLVGMDQVVASAEDVYLAKEQAETVAATVAAAIDRLEIQSHRECIQLRFFEQCSVDQTAEFFGISVSAVKALQFRATRKLARELAKVA